MNPPQHRPVAYERLHEQVATALHTAGCGCPGWTYTAGCRAEQDTDDPLYGHLAAAVLALGDVDEVPEPPPPGRFFPTGRTQLRLTLPAEPAEATGR